MILAQQLLLKNELESVGNKRRNQQNVSNDLQALNRERYTVLASDELEEK